MVVFWSCVLAYILYANRESIVSFFKGMINRKNLSDKMR